MKHLFISVLLCTIFSFAFSSCSKSTISRAEAEQQLAQMVDEYQSIAEEMVSKFKEIATPEDFTAQSKEILAEFQTRMSAMEKYNELEEIVEKNYPDLYDETTLKINTILQNFKDSFSEIIQDICGGTLSENVLKSIF